jgi:hypothetical protein
MAMKEWKIVGGAQKVEITMGDGQRVTMPAESAVSLAATLLEAARASYKSTGTQPPGGEVSWHLISPTSMSIGESPKSGHVAIVFAFGEGALGVSVEEAHLKQLGEALLAASASGPQH